MAVEQIPLSPDRADREGPRGTACSRTEDVMKAKFLAFLRDETGLTMVEYAVGGGLIIAVAILAITTLGQNVNTVFQNLGSA
jgi:pilus assembly protein Flp/PilA